MAFHEVTFPDKVTIGAVAGPGLEPGQGTQGLGAAVPQP